MKLHGNNKYRFEELNNSGDKIIVKTANIYSLKASFRKFKKKSESHNFDVSFNEYTNGKVEIVRL